MIRSLDTAKRALYKPPPLSGALRVVSAGVLLVAGLVFSGVALADVVNGVQLPDGAEKVGENRYRTRTDFEGTLKYFKTIYPPGQYPRHSIVKQPGVQAIHIENPTGKKWEGINIYQAGEEVRIFVIAAPEPVKPAKKQPAAQPAPKK